MWKNSNIVYVEKPVANPLQKIKIKNNQKSKKLKAHL